MFEGLVCGFAVFVLLAAVVMVVVAVVMGRRGDARFRDALARHPELTLRGERLRTVFTPQLWSRDTEYEVRSANAPSVRIRPSYLGIHHDPTDVPMPDHPRRELAAQQLLDGWIDDVRYPSRLEIIRGPQPVVEHVRYFNHRKALPAQPPLASDVSVRGDAPCPEAARAAILAFLEEGSMLCFEPEGVWFQARRTNALVLDETAVPDILALFARAHALRVALHAT